MSTKPPLPPQATTKRLLEPNPNISEPNPNTTEEILFDDDDDRALMFDIHNDNAPTNPLPFAAYSAPAKMVESSEDQSNSSVAANDKVKG